MGNQQAFFKQQPVNAASLKQTWRTEFQTPDWVAKYMCSLIPTQCVTVLEPTPGLGNIVKEVPDRCRITALPDFFQRDKNARYDCIVMNPPFSSTWCFNMPEGYAKGMKVGYQILYDCMQQSDNVIALMPWFTISDSDKRLREIKRFGLKKVIALPRRTFAYARIQTVVLVMEKGFSGITEFLVYDCLNDNLKMAMF